VFKKKYLWNEFGMFSSKRGGGCVWDELIVGCSRDGHKKDGHIESMRETKLGTLKKGILGSKRKGREINPGWKV